MVKNCAWWSDTVEIRLSAIQSSLIILPKMLSMKIWAWFINLVGEVMLGRRLVEMWCQESQKHFYLSHISENQYQNHWFTLFLLINFSDRSFWYW